MKLLSWNVNGIRAITQKNFVQDILAENPDVFCLQETKATAEQTLEATNGAFKDYHFYGNEADKKGYSGTAIFSKTKALNVFTTIGKEEHDNEGRIVGLEFDSFYLINVYVPNSGSELKRLEYRTQWDKDFLAFCTNLDAQKPVVICGDLNVAHQAIDLKNPKANYNKSAGYMQEEIDGIAAFLKNGFVDSFRHFYPDNEKYTWWSYRAGARSRNIGWRIDYFLVSQKLIDKVTQAHIHNDLMGSDHCAVSIQINS